MTALLVSLGLLALLDLIAVARWVHADSDGRPPGAAGPVGSMSWPVARPVLEAPPRGPHGRTLTNNLEEKQVEGHDD